MEEGRILALDYGTKRIGMALSDAMRITGQPFGTIESKTRDEALAEIEKIVERENVTEIVIGLPRRLDGSIGEMGDQAKALAGQLRDRLSIKIKLWDERFSTHAAERTLLEGDVKRKKRKKVIDQTAAAWILQGYLDRLGMQ